MLFSSLPGLTWQSMRRGAELRSIEVRQDRIDRRVVPVVTKEESRSIYTPPGTSGLLAFARLQKQ
jgi:hypothetical protein